MAEIVVGAVVTVLFEKLASADFMKMARSEGIDGQLNKWNKTFSDIQLVLADAEQKQITNRFVQSWLHDLQDLAYDIDDVLDDMTTEVMQRKLNNEFDASSSSSTNTSKLLKFFPTSYTNFTPGNFIYGHKMSSKLDEISTKLHDLFERKNTLGLNVNVERSNRAYKKLEETSLVEESDVIGREGDEEKLLEKLLGNEEACNKNVSIVSIVGLGGIGKTTLAKVLYNKKEVKEHFEVRAWVCISEEFNVTTISKAIFQAVVGKNQEFANLDLLHVALKEKLSNKRFLVVLDDVWNEDYNEWERLQSPFRAGEPGSKILVTTRKEKVASMMMSSQSYDLKVLSEEKAMSLFALHALNEQNFDKYPTLKLLGEGIVKKCGRLPLALKTLGRVLGTKKENDDEWEEVLNSEIWDIHDADDILPALRLSYYDLPSHLKQLFAYCSLIPKDYVFDKNELVLLWMAQGFLNQSNDKKSKESLGDGYFEELKLRSFFQTSTTDNYGQSRYIMHDLINDLATSVAGKVFFRLDDKMDTNNMNESFEKFRHVSFIGRDYGTYRKFKELQRARGLRTFLPLDSWPRFKLSNNDLDELLHQLQFVRVLSLSNHYSITEVPQSIGSLKHIRYLNFSATNIERLPEQVCDLYNLQSLLVSGCKKLSSLPASFAKLINLRHLNFSRTNIERLPEQVSDLYNLQSLLVSGCEELCSLPASFAKLINLRHLDIDNTPKLKKMPSGIGGLTGLQTLPKVIIEGGNGFKISELKGLSNIQGELSILGLEKVINPNQANDAKLQEKKGIDDLVMRWSDDSRDQMIEYEVLEGLRPHHKLRKLKILFYGGMEFPSWVGDSSSFDQLTKLTLKGCRRCTHLPGALGAVEDLSIRECDELRYLCESKSEFLVSLRKLEISNCKKLVSLGENVEISMKNVRQVSLHNCESLESYNCPNSVESLAINDCDSLTSLTFSTMHELPSSLKTLSVVYCNNLEYISDKGFGIIPQESLRIRNCKNLKSLPIRHEKLESLTSLKYLDIYDCPSMDYSFPCGLWPPNLRKLRIGCLNKAMSEWGIQNYPTSLVDLTLLGENSGVVSFVGNAKDVSSSSFLLPPSLTHLTIFEFKDVESVTEVLQHLPCLKQLYIQSCPKLKDLPETDPSSLKIRVR